MTINDNANYEDVSDVELQIEDAFERGRHFGIIEGIQEREEYARKAISAAFSFFIEECRDEIPKRSVTACQKARSFQLRVITNKP